MEKRHSHFTSEHPLKNFLGDAIQLENRHLQTGIDMSSENTVLSSPVNERCPLCLSRSAPFYKDEKSGGREFLRCSHCELIFVPPRYFLSADQERGRYEQHKNYPGDPAYRTFLSRVSSVLIPRLKPGDHGLDFGCGPGPALAEMLRESGFHVSLFDPFFHADPLALKNCYDFVTCTEAAEHFHSPRREFRMLATLLKPGGWLALMTQRVEDPSSFAGWYYHRDPTHVCFFSQTTLRWLAGSFGWTVEFPSRDVALFHARETR